MNQALRVFISTLLSVAILAASSVVSASDAMPFSPLRATSFYPVQTTIGELSDSELERALISEIHRVAEQVFSEIQAKDPHARVTHLRKVERAVIHRLKETGKLIDLARSLNPKIGISVVATEVVVTALSFGLMSTGNVLAGTVVLNFPSAPLVLSLMVAYEIQKIKWQIGRELKTSIRELEKISKEVVGYNLKNKITSLILQDGNVQRELELVNKQVKGRKLAPEVITLKEIEKVIALTPHGESFLAHAYHEKGNKEVYGTLLLQYLNDSPESLTKLLEEVAKRTAAQSEVQKFAELRKHLIEVSDIQKHIDRELKAARKEISINKKKVKRGEMSKDESLKARAHLKAEISRLNEVRIQSFRHKYKLLLKAKDAYANENQIEVENLVARSKVELGELKVVSSFARIRQTTNVVRTCQQVFSVAY